MARDDKSIAERQGSKGGYELMFGSSDSADLTKAAKQKMAQHDYAGLRGFVLNALGIEEKENPEYLIIIGCVRVFDSPDGLRNYFGLLDKLNVTYTFLRTTEYCSNLPALHTAAGEQAWQAAWEGARDLGEKNLEQARKLGVKGVAYFCSDSYAIAQQVFTKFGLDMEPIFYLDILPERLKGRTLRLDPCVVGFFPGVLARAAPGQQRVETEPPGVAGHGRTHRGSGGGRSTLAHLLQGGSLGLGRGGGEPGGRLYRHALPRTGPGKLSEAESECPPRPCPPEREVFIKELVKQVPYYDARLTVKPGITGWAQINYSYGASVEDAIEKLNYDLFYIKNMSFLMDLLIILRTVKIVLFGTGAR